MSRKSSYWEEFQEITSGKAFRFCVLLVVLLAFGFATFNMAVSTDDLQGEVYVGSGRQMLTSGRFAIYLVDMLTASTLRGPAAAYTNDLLSILGLVWAAVNFCIFFRKVCASAISSAACTVFTCVFVSYPLIPELWEYLAAYRAVAFGFLCDSFVLILMYDVIHEKQPGNWKKILASSVLMMLVCAGYESLVPVYIFSVFTILALQVVYGTKKEKTLTEIIRQGLCYAGVLAAGLMLRVVVHRLILLVLETDSVINGATTIVWGHHSVGVVLLRTFRGIVENYLLRAIVYFPLTELVIAGVVLLVIGIAAARRFGWTILLPGMGMYLSLILLCLVQGCVTHYRSCQVFTIFVAFAVMVVVMVAERQKRPWLRILVLVLCGYLCFHQADQTNHFLTLNYLRSEEEADVIQKIGSDLYGSFDVRKPVIFVGEHMLSDAINEAASVPENSGIWKFYQKVYAAADVLMSKLNVPLSEPERKLPQSNVNSVISFGVNAFGYSQTAMAQLMTFYGYDYELPYCYELLPEAEAYVAENQVPAYPADGYIQDAGSYIVIHLCAPAER